MSGLLLCSDLSKTWGVAELGLCGFNLCFAHPFLASVQVKWEREKLPILLLTLLALAGAETRGFVPSLCLWEALGHVFLLSASKVEGHKGDKVSNKSPKAALAEDLSQFKTATMGAQRSPRQVAQ